MTYPRSPTIPLLTHHSSLTYKSPPTRLQTLDIWLPPPQPQNASKKEGTWLVYVHGGAWRDPLQDALCVVPTLRALTTTHPALFQSDERGGGIAGIASLTYRLSPYANHPTAPSAPDDPARNVQHPAHAEDVRDALAYLAEEHDMRTWIGVGHSCGATLLLQLPLVCGDAHGGIREGLRGLLLLAGIYDVPAFLASHVPPGCPEHIAKIYAAIVEGAFGADEKVYAGVSPTGVGELWGRYVVLGYSGEDELVEAGQRGVMLARYLREGWVEAGGEGEGEKVVEVRDLTMGHDEVWEDGRQVAELIAEVVGRVGVR